MSDDASTSWSPATVEEVTKIVQEHLADCDREQLAAFERYAVTLHFAPILRHGKNEHVVVVAQRATGTIYWEDVEEGFNLSSTTPEGELLDHRCNQDGLGLALNQWIGDRTRR
jgi:hypothetical protein